MSAGDFDCCDDPFDAATGPVSFVPTFEPMLDHSVVMGKFADGSAEWHEARSSGLGGSEISAVLSQNPWESPYSLFHRKRTGEVKVLDDPVIEWGHRLEPAVALKLQDVLAEMYPDRDLYVINPGTTHRSSDPGRAWQIANPDRYLAEGNPSSWDSVRICPIELKTAMYADGWGQSMTNEVPVYYHMQLQHYIDVTGAWGGWLAVLIGGSDFRYYWLPRNDALIQEMRDAGSQFMAWLAAGEAPDLDGHTETLKAVRRQHPEIEDREVEIPEELSTSWHKAKQAVEDAEKWSRECNALIMAMLGKAKRGVVDGKRHVMRSPTANGGAPHLRSSLPKRKKNL